MPPIALLIALPAACSNSGPRTGYTVLDWFWYYPLFAFGARRSALLWAWAPRLGHWPGADRGRAALGAGDPVCGADRPAARHPVTAALALLAVPAGLGLAVRLAALGGPVARGLILVGRNTLPIYVLHPSGDAVLLPAFQRPEPLPRRPGCCSCAAVALVVSCLLGRLLGRIPGLFGLPPLPAGWSARPREPARDTA